jgi:S1-C subfamily serine protease
MKRERTRPFAPIALLAAVTVLLAVAVFAAAREAKADAIENAVVKVFATTLRPDSFKPWTKQAPREVTGTVVIIEGNRILTNAHVVLYASQVQAQANQSGDRVSASVAVIAPGIDLAVLRLEDEALFATRPPIARTSELPDVKEPVLASGASDPPDADRRPSGRLPAVLRVRPSGLLDRDDAARRRHRRQRPVAEPAKSPW